MIRGIDIVGSPTAGANGDSRSVTLPTGSSVFFTGRKVTRHDGTRSHVEGIRAGKDEVLDRALDVIRSAVQTAHPAQPGGSHVP